MKIFKFLPFLILFYSCEFKSESKHILNQDVIAMEQNTTLDSINVFIENKKNINFDLVYYDDFDNYYPLHNGKNIIPANVVIKNYGGQIRTLCFLNLCRSKDIIFSTDTLGNWIAKTQDKGESDALNFFTYLNQQVKPLNTELQTFLRQEYWDKSFVTFPEMRDSLIDKDFKRKVNFLNDYTLKKNLPEKIKITFQNIIEYEKINAKLRLPVNPIQKWKKTYLTELSDKYILSFQNDNNLFIPFYKMGAFNSIYLIQFLTYNTTEINITNYYKIIASKFSGKTKDYLLTHLLILSKDNRTGIKFTVEEYKNLLRQYMLDCRTEEYKIYIKENSEEYATSLKNAQVLSPLTKQVIDFDTLIQKNKITYIDFWASWCLPCRTEMPASLILKQEFSHEDINFIYLSIDTDIAAWLKTMKQIGLKESESYLLLNGKESILAKQLSIKTIPRYVLVGKDGKIIDSNAKRPSETELKKQLRDLLSK